MLARHSYVSASWTLLDKQYRAQQAAEFAKYLDRSFGALWKIRFPDLAPPRCMCNISRRVKAIDPQAYGIEYCLDRVDAKGQLLVVDFDAVSASAQDAFNEMDKRLAKFKMLPLVVMLEAKAYQFELVVRVWFINFNNMPR